MRAVVVGGTGLVGSKVVAALQAAGHEAVAASPSTGVDSVADLGLDEAFTGADVVLDVTNSVSFEEEVATPFFVSSTQHQLAAERRVGVAHHVALSIVGLEQATELGYYRAKLAQEAAVRAGGVPWTIVRATQFMEFMPAVLEANADGQTVRLSPLVLQPIAVVDLVADLVDVVLGPPLNGTVDVAGPDALPLDEIGRRLLARTGDARKVLSDPDATPMFGAPIGERVLAAPPGAQLGTTGLEDWLAARV